MIGLNFHIKIIKFIYHESGLMYIFFTRYKSIGAIFPTLLYTNINRCFAINISKL